MVPWSCNRRVGYRFPYRTPRVVFCSLFRMCHGYVFYVKGFRTKCILMRRIFPFVSLFVEKFSLRLLAAVHRPSAFYLFIYLFYLFAHVVVGLFPGPGGWAATRRLQCVRPTRRVNYACDTRWPMHLVEEMLCVGRKTAAAPVTSYMVSIKCFLFTFQ